MPLRHRVVMLTTLVSLVVSLVFATTGAPAAPGLTDTPVAASTVEASSDDVARAADADETRQNARRDQTDREKRENRRGGQDELPSPTLPPTTTEPPTTSTTQAPPSTTTTRVPPSSTTTSTQAPPPSTTTTQAPPSTTTTTRVPPTQPPPSSTTTTTPPVTQPPVTQPPSAQAVGVVGCSNTAQGIEGVEVVLGQGGTAFWSYTAVGQPGVEGGIGGGSLEKWANPSESYWDYLDVMAQENPSTQTIWYQICIRASARVGAGEAATAGEIADAEFVVSEIKKRFPSATIYVSPLNDYLNGHTCGGTGQYGVGVAAELSDHLTSSGAALRGPTMSPMAVSDTTDGCHASDAFLPVWGSDLLAFFG
ncbi:MAG: hypothetical protein HKN07_01475 [Acidimicrobiia bacterium]|nr:hypothetical protein [Acidimicrobiia bacterium]